MLVAIHQPNFIPWWPFFEKMALADHFIILTTCQFEKGGYQNRYQIGDKWITNPVRHGLDRICDKTYTDGRTMVDVNMKWINAIRETLGINTPMSLDPVTTVEMEASERLVYLVKNQYGDAYLTNPMAFDKYLDVSVFEASGIKIVPFRTLYPVHTFQMFEHYGIEGCRKILSRNKEMMNAVSHRKSKGSNGDSRTQSVETIQAK